MSFSAEDAGDSVEIESSYHLNEASSSHEEVAASFDALEIEDSRSISGIADDDGVLVSSRFSAENARLSLDQKAWTNWNGEDLKASSSFDASGIFRGNGRAGFDSSRIFASQELHLTGDAWSAASAGAGRELSSVKVHAHGGSDIRIGSYSRASNGLFEGEVVHRTQAGADAIGYADEAGGEGRARYSGVYSAESEGGWTGGQGDLNIGAKTVRSAVADTEIISDGDSAWARTGSFKGGVRRSGLQATFKSGDEGACYKAHLYSHAYPASSYGLYADKGKFPDGWEEFVSTGSAGVAGKGDFDLSRWEGGALGWDHVGSFSSPENGSRAVRAVDAKTTLKGAEEWSWHAEVETRDQTPSEQVPRGIKYMYSNEDLKRTSGGRGVDVAVIDTGADTTHPDLFMRMEDYFDIYHSGGFEWQKDRPDMSGHGTHVSGTVAADGGIDCQGIYGMAPEADIHAYNALGYGGGSYEDVALGIYRATDLGSDIISMSLGGCNFDQGYVDPNTKRAVEYAQASDTLLVVAAGNYGSDYPTIGIPARYPGVIAVGAINEDGEAAWFTSSGYNDGDGVIEEKEVTFGAPGVNVPSTFPTYRGWYAYGMGTSMACPHISGMAAKLLSERLYEEYTPADMAGIMKENARGNEIVYSDDGSRIPGNPKDNCLTGLGVPRLPEGSI